MHEQSILMDFFVFAGTPNICMKYLNVHVSHASPTPIAEEFTNAFKMHIVIFQDSKRGFVI